MYEFLGFWEIVPLQSWVSFGCVLMLKSLLPDFGLGHTQKLQWQESLDFELSSAFG